MTLLQFFLLVLSSFQLTRSRGAWRAVVINHNVYNEFQLTRSRGAWLLRLHTPPVPLHFNSHAHVERDLISSFVVKSEWNFNSHAHVERDSLTSSFIISLWYFNSHAHVERDHKVEWFERTCEHFNSHAHVERDDFLYLLDKFQQISTHTLTWSVTPARFMRLRSSTFQLTRSRGAWRSYHPFYSQTFHFNSHAHVERDI